MTRKAGRMTTDMPQPPQPSLRQRILRAASWDVGGSIVGSALRLASNLIMTRLLMPEAFGMLALAVTIMTAITLSTDIGIHRSITREPDGDQTHFLRVAWVVKILRSSFIAAGILLAALGVWFLAPAYAPEGTIYAQPEMPGLIAMIALSPLINGLVSTRRELAIRQMNRKPTVLIRLSGQALSVLSMILFAQISPTVWALMCGMLVNNLVFCIASHLFMEGPTMRFEWNRGIADRLWKFGKWIMASSALSFLARNADKFVLGGLLGSATFGLYVIAQIWIDSIRQVIGQLNNGLGFPVVAETSRTRPKEMPRLYRRFQYRIDLICVGAFLLGVLGGPALIGLLYTDAYQDAGRYLQLMAFMLLVLRFNTLGSLVLNAGNSRAMLITAILRAVASIGLMILGYRYFGVEGAILGVAAAPLASLPYVLWLVRPILGARETRIDVIWGIAVFTLTLAAFWWI